jgi:hypothetical protein
MEKRTVSCFTDKLKFYYKKESYIMSLHKFTIMIKRLNLLPKKAWILNKKYVDVYCTANNVVVPKIFCEAIQEQQNIMLNVHPESNFHSLIWVFLLFKYCKIYSSTFFSQAIQFYLPFNNVAHSFCRVLSGKGVRIYI